MLSWTEADLVLEAPVGQDTQRLYVDTQATRVLELSLGHSAWYWVHHGEHRQRLKFTLHQGRLLLDDCLQCVGLDMSNTMAEAWLGQASAEEQAAIRTAKIPNPEDLHFLELLPQLEALECSGLSDEDLERVCSLGLPLTFFHLSWCSQLTTLRPLSRLAGLTRLVLADCMTLKDISVLSQLTALKSLQIINADQVRELGSLTPLRGLKRLALRNCDGIDDLTPLASLSELAWLDLSRCDRIRDLGPLSGLKSLVSLDLSGCRALRQLSPLRPLDNLEELQLFGCDGVRDLTPLYHMCYLRSLSLPNGTLDGDLLAICMEHSELQHLDLRNCQNIGDLSPLVRTKNLTHLNLAGCRNITDLAPLARLRQLVRLDLAHCTGVRSLEPLYGLERLRDVYVGGCTGLSAADRAALRKACPQCRVHTV